MIPWPATPDRFAFNKSSTLPQQPMRRLAEAEKENWHKRSVHANLQNVTRNLERAKRRLRISRPGVRVPSIAPENAVKSKDFMAFLFSCNTAARFLHGRCTVRVFCVELCRARDCIAIRALFCIQVNSARRSCAFVSGSASFRSSKSAAMESAVFPWTGGVWALASGLA